MTCGFPVATLAAEISGELRCWHKVTLSVNGPQAKETDTAPNPFVDYRFAITFTHPASGETYTVPGYFAADGKAGESGADRGDVWRAHLAPSKAGAWRYQISFVAGKQAAIDESVATTPVEGVDGLTGSFEVKPTDKKGRDFRGRGRLQYVGERYLRFAESGDWFIKAGADAPETLLAYEDFDGTTTRNTPLKNWAPHVGDWREGDPSWQAGKGKGLVGAINYLASRGGNAISFLPYNAGGDGDNVWPMISPDKKTHYDCSKLDQWQIVFDHAQQQGVFLHFKLQETENDDTRGNNKHAKGKAASLDGGDLGVERKLYLRELIARFGYELALNWNLGEENTQSVAQQRAMARYLRAIDPYDHLVVLHTYPQQQQKRYQPHLGDKTTLTGLSLQNHWDQAHRRTKQWVIASAEAGHKWVCCNDEQGPAKFGVPTDPNFKQHPQRKAKGKANYTPDDIRKQTLWGTLLAGGAGVEYYFGYKHAENDLMCEDFRSRQSLWDDCHHAIEFFANHKLPLTQMWPSDELVKFQSDASASPGGYCLAKPGGAHLIYLLDGGVAFVSTSTLPEQRSVFWYNPRSGEQQPNEPTVSNSVDTEAFVAPTSNEDWLLVIRKKP